MYFRINDKPIFEEFKLGNTVERYNVKGKKIPMWVIVFIVLVFLMLSAILVRAVMNKKSSFTTPVQTYGFKFY
jgi:uncharacterized membrane protein YvbJ